MDVLKFDRMLQRRLKIVEVDPPMVKRYVNEGFSGGEKKRAEVLQMAVLEPTLAVLDETRFPGSTSTPCASSLRASTRYVAPTTP